MKLSTVLSQVPYKVLHGDRNVEISDICYDSRKVKPGDVYVAIVGSSVDGHRYIKEAAAKGAVAVVLSKGCPKDLGITVIKVADTSKALALMSAQFFDFPADKLKLIGVTGTKGKTTITYMIRAILEEAGIKCGLIGTIEIDTKTAREESKLTTPESYEIHRALRTMVDKGCKAAVLEVSSQGLMKQRVYGINFDYGVFINISKDHIGKGEHSSFKEYLYWKNQLFNQCQVGIINGDDFHADEIIRHSSCSWQIFGKTNNSRLVTTEIQPKLINDKLGMEFTLKGVYNITLVLPIAGIFTVYNVMAATMVAYQFHIEEKVIKKALEKVEVPGRQQTLRTYSGAFVIIDYAHNGKSLESLLTSLRDYEPRRIICVFGCGGNRDRGRRWEMGQVSGKLADLTVITTDNPRNDSTFSIIDDIIIGIKRSNGNYIIVDDRRKAIYHAIAASRAGDIVVIAGKGHETYQIIGNKRLYFDDVAEARLSIEKVKDEQNYSRGNN